MMERSSLLQQLKTHFIPLVSLAVALAALFYTTWREENTEKNRNLRVAAFEVLKNLGELQVVVNYTHYDPTNPMANPMLGWGHVALISDLSQLLPSPVPESTEQLVNTWNQTWKTLKTDEDNTQLLSREIDASRDAILSVLSRLR